MPSARLFFFLFTHAKYVRLSICLRFSVLRLHFHLCLFAFSDDAPAYAKFFSDHLTAFPLFIPGCIPVFSDIKKDAELFLCVLCPRVIRVWSRRVNFWQNFLQNDQIFCLDPPGNPCSLLFCRFLCIFTLRQWQNQFKNP